MRPSKRLLPLFLLLPLMSGCSSSDSQLEAIATQLSEAVNRCVIDVRDKTAKYDTSPTCRSLGRIAQQYVDAGGLKESAPCRADRIAEAARERALKEVGVSESRDSGHRH